MFHRFRKTIVDEDKKHADQADGDDELFRNNDCNVDQEQDEENEAKI